MDAEYGNGMPSGHLDEALGMLLLLAAPRNLWGNGKRIPGGAAYSERERGE